MMSYFCSFKSNVRPSFILLKPVLFNLFYIFQIGCENTLKQLRQNLLPIFGERSFQVT
jgi:hypothetical protein